MKTLPQSNEWVVSRRAFLRAGAAAVWGSLLSPARAAPKKAPLVRFGLVTDVHYADAPARGSRCYRESLAKLRECVREINSRGADFLIELGDFKDQDEPPQEERTLRYLEAAEKVFSEFHGPRRHVPGNHDFDSLSPGQFFACVRDRGAKPDCLYYAFDCRGVRCLVLDCNYTADGRHYDHGRFDWRDANLPDEELAWLESELRAGAGPAIVFTHQLLDGEGTVFVNNAAKVRAILERSGRVRAVFQGHHHPGRYSFLGGIHYYTLRAVVEGCGAENNAYAFAEAFEDGAIQVTGYRKAVTMRLPPRAAPGTPLEGEVPASKLGNK